ncbi:SpaA isopeptide-forming pilin-related protein [uncultured Clostridium sp.]|uniref:SpaA isopeptide-forming pilin-related protein n=1 Tax=uncultured Clostridium sp. TaxID=59620 RepID=UPI0025E0942D|nr:SpaA isopeptide-forming pilin-related protein [uncultured Clostridium sp.]
MRKLKVDKFKFYLKILSIILIINLIIGYFPRNLAIADTVIGSNTDTINDVYMADIDISNAVDAIDTRKAIDTNADYLGNVTFYNYYGKYQTADTTDNSDNDHYSFERFNRAISNYASSTGMEYPLYFGDFNGAANNSNNPEQNPLQGQTLGGSAYRFYWAINRANRNANYSASLQGLVSEKLDSQGYITQNSTGGFYTTDENSNKYYYGEDNSSIMGAGDRWFKYEDKFGRSGTLQIWLDGNDSNSICERIKITAKEKDYSSTSKYLVFEVYNDGTGNSGSPYISIEDGNLNKIGGWAEGFTTTYSDNKMPAKGSGWKKIIIDLEKLKNNSNFDFSNITNIYLGYWASGDIYINDIRFVGEIESTQVRLPYFDESFVTGNVGETISNLEFPFKKRLKTENGLDTYYYTFSSGKSGYKFNSSNITDVVRINRETNNLDYWFDVSDNDNSIIVRDMNGTSGWGTGKNEPGFFPFNNPLDSSNASKLNYGFGSKIEIQFKLTADGKVKNIHGKDVPIEFNFKGDDDVWVYIDNKLALDMGGAHSQTTGKIDFASRKSTVDNVVIGDLKSNSLYQRVDSVTTDLKLADDSYTSDGKYDTNKVHTLTLFYMERGMIESNLYMDFNFIPSENELIVEKEVDTSGVNEILARTTEKIAKDMQFKFKVFEGTVAKTDTEYVYSANNNNPRTDDITGTFLLKDEETATFINKFSESSKVYITEEQDDRFTTSWRWDKTANNFQGDTSGEGYKTSEVTIPSSQELFEKYTYHAIFTNKIKTGTLRISKDIELLEGETIEDYKNDIFNFKVTFTDILGTKLDQPIEYTLQLKAGQTTEITGIPVGTKYEIVELLEGEIGNKYEIESITGVEVKGSTVNGQITVDDTEIEITYVNRKKLRDVQLIKVDSIDSNIKLENAEFILNKLKEDGSIDGNFTSIKVTTDQNGQAFFNNLPYGKYIITEIEAPEGYELLKEPIKFEVNKDSNNSIITIEVKNNKSIKLPIAGGNGNITSKYIGFMLIGLAGVLYSFMLIRNKKYKFN